MEYKKFNFQVKKLFVFILLSVFSIFASSLVTLIPLVESISKNISVILSMVGMILILIMGFWLVKKMNLQGNGQLFSKKKITLYIFGYLLIQIVGYVCLFLQSSFEGARDATFLSELNNIPGILLFLSSTLVGPIIEEIVFRGFVIGYWFKEQPVIGIIVSSISFAMFHAKENIFILLMYFLSSIIYGLVYMKSKRLEGSVIIHVLNNLPGGISML